MLRAPENCFVHVPKTGGTSIERAFGLKHDHVPFNASSCKNVFSVLRDPVDRASSAYHFCRQTPWDGVLKRNNTNHCCHSRVVRALPLSSWVELVLGGNAPCGMPGAGRPHPFVAPMEYWLGEEWWRDARVNLLRTHCLIADGRAVLNATVWHEYRTNVSSACLGLTERAWNVVSAHCKQEFSVLYGRNVVDMNDWSDSCARRTCSRWARLRRPELAPPSAT